MQDQFHRYLLIFLLYSFPIFLIPLPLPSSLSFTLERCRSVDQFVVALTMWICIRKVLGSNLDLGHPLLWRRFFMVWFTTSAYNPLLSEPLRFTIHQTSYHSTLYTLRYWRRRYIYIYISNQCHPMYYVNFNAFPELCNLCERMEIYFKLAYIYMLFSSYMGWSTLVI
jgi:hypothetical protein